MPSRELISKRTRTEFREVLSGWGTLRTIGIFFENEGFTPESTYQPDVGGERRGYVEQYYRAIDFCNPAHVLRLLRVYEDIICELEKSQNELADKLKLCLERDGYRFENGRLLL